MPLSVNLSFWVAAIWSSFFKCASEPVARNKAIGYSSDFTANNFALNPSLKTTEQ